jgi:FlaA1/EpsC-like NDP-sugar epimerase
MFINKRVLITGGTGTWGKELAKQLLKDAVSEIVIFSRGEAAQVAMKHAFCDDRLKFVIGDIRDSKAIIEACKDIDIVFHTAALKHVTKCELQPREAVKTNIYGTQNVIDACIDNNVRLCVNISSDKACDANCFYGKTKAVAEGLITEANNQTHMTDFFSIRSGNILGSSGSVVPIWIDQIKKNNEIKITDKKMRRFFIAIPDAIKYTFEAMELSDRGEVFVFRMPSFLIYDLAKLLIKKYGYNSTKIKYIGLMKGERLKEWLVTPEEVNRTIKRKHFYIIYPLIDVNNTDYPVIPKAKYPTGFNMDDPDFPDASVLRKMLTRAGY